MDLALDQVPMEGYLCPLETTVYLEETQESIVPDACPDILSILATEARARLTKKSCGEGRVELTGTVAVTVVYCPEGEKGPRRLEMTIPYHATAGAEELTETCALVAVPRVTQAETRVLNPRKVLCRVEVAVQCQGWKENDERLCVPAGDEEDLQQRCEEAENYAVTAVAEKAFAYTDQVSLSASYPAAEELLGHRLELNCAEAKIIGNKLIFKGQAVLLARYRGEDETLRVGRWELPFSQIMEIGGVEEEGSCAIDLVERDSQVTLSAEGDGRTLAVHLELLAQAVVRQNRQVTLFTDAYSVSRRVNVQRRNWQLCQRWEESSVTQTGHLALETEEPARSVVDCLVTLGQPRLEPGAQSALTARGQVTVLYLDEREQLRSQQGMMEVTAQVAVPEGAGCLVRCESMGDTQAVATAAGIEVRGSVRFHYLITQVREVSAVAALEVEEPEEGEARPSVVLYMAQKGESLWDIAKAYSTTQEDIRGANDLSETEELGGMRLLIPRSR